jgi:hypothetical protein
MQNRNAAQIATETLLSVTDSLISSVVQIDGLEEEGKVSHKEADAYRSGIMPLVGQLFESVLNPILQIHPDLRPKCRCCESSETKGEHRK